MSGATQSVTRSLGDLQQARDATSRAELADQGFRITGDSAFASIHARALDDIDATLLRYEQSTAFRTGDPGRGRAGGLTRPHYDVSKMEMSEIRRIVAAGEADESDFLKREAAGWERKTVRFNATVLLVSSLSMVTMGGAICATLLRETAIRRQRDGAEAEAQGRLANVMETLPSAFLAVDEHLRVTYVNGQAMSLLRNEKQGILGRPLRHVVPQTLGDSLEGRCREVLDTHDARQFEMLDPLRDLWFAVEISPSPYGVSVYMRDVTDAKRALETQERLLALLEATPDVVGINDVHGTCYFNRAGRELFGVGEAGANPESGLPASGDVDVARLQQEVFPIGLERGVWRVEKMIRVRDGSRIPVSQVAIAHKDRDGSVAFVSTIMRDISERKQAENQLQEQMRLVERYSHELEDANKRLTALATTDGLTNLQNHRAFQELLADEFQRTSRYGGALSVILLDVDYFKQFNDEFGHPAGDQVLKRLASVLQLTARATDTAARYGGEEFVVILPETDVQGALEAAERIRKAVAEQPWDRRHVTVSVGAATSDPHTDSPAALLEQADQALYVSKSNGRNRVTHADSVDTIAEGHDENHELRAA